MRQSESAFRELNEHLEHRVRDRTSQLDAVNQELEAFSYSVSHDLRAPLRHVNGFVQMLTKRESGRLDDTSKRYLNIVSDSTVKMGTLIDELLAFSRTSRQEIKSTRVSLGSLVDETRKILAPAIGDRNITWIVSVLPDVEGDETLLGLVITNLLSNAVKYTRNQKDPRIEIGIESENGDEATVFIRDNGSGFDMAYADKLFGVFQRLHREAEFEGIGIGLATARRIVDRHGGRIWASGEVEKGATFYFTLKKSQV